MVKNDGKVSFRYPEMLWCPSETIAIHASYAHILRTLLRLIGVRAFQSHFIISRDFQLKIKCFILSININLLINLYSYFPMFALLIFGKMKTTYYVQLLHHCILYNDFNFFLNFKFCGFFYILFLYFILCRVIF